MSYNVREHSYVVGGLGVTGQACVRFLLQHEASVKAFDTREHLTLPNDLVSALEGKLTTNPLTESYFEGVDTLVLSPGLAVDIEQVTIAKSCGVEVIGDVELFARLNRELGSPKHVVGITGSNGKTTVTLLTNHLLNACGVKSIEAGNVGRPVLEAIQSDADVIVMELSSFQLETTSSLSLVAATVLNITDDHLDRHGNLESYIDAKHRIFDNAKTAVVWRDGEFVAPDIEAEQALSNVVEYGLGDSDTGFCVRNIDREDTLVFDGQPLVKLNDIPLTGTHNVLNVMAALAICSELGIAPEQAVAHLSSFKSAPHRCIEIAHQNGIRYIDDSKATNVGATIAALEGLSSLTQGRLILIAGGDAKGADMQTLAPHLERHVSRVFAIGKDAMRIAEVFDKTTLHGSMQEAVQSAITYAESGDVVLLSPACASIDMFKNYISRGEAFKHAVESVLCNAEKTQEVVS